MSDVTSLFRDIESKIGDKSFNLLYSSVGDVSAHDFHVKCDGKGATLTVLYGKFNTIFGGYTSQDWSFEKMRSKRDEEAFLFFKNDNAEAKCVFFPIKQGHEDMAITCDSNMGPTFGGGPLFWQNFDLQTFKKGKKTKECELEDMNIRLNGTMNIGNAYQIQSDSKTQKSNGEAANDVPIKTTDINGGTLIVKRFEVYQVVADKLPTPWRNMPTEPEAKQIQESLEKLEPIPGLGIMHYNILLIGMIGSGKSSICNTFFSVFSRIIKKPAPARDLPTSVTNKVNVYTLKTSAGNDMSIRLIDIRGFEDQRGYENELSLLLEGRLPAAYIFPEKPSDIKQTKNAALKDEIHLVCFVTGTSNLDLITDTLSSRFEEIQKCINKKGLPMVVVATKFDEICPKILKDAANLYTSPKALNAAKKIAHFFGVEEKLVFPVVNYVNEEEVTSGKDKLALQAMYAMVKLAKDYLENHQDMVTKSDQWSQRGTKLTVPKHKQEKEAILIELAAKMNMFSEDQPLRVLCVGAVHSGKSSFIDSIASLLTDEICSKASGGYVMDIQSKQLDSTTKKFQMFQMKFKDESGEMIKSKVFFGDVPGFQDVGGIQLNDVKYVVEGHVPNKYRIKDGIKKDSKKFIKKEASKKNRIHCVCYIFDISNACDDLPKNIEQTFKSLKEWLFDKEERKRISGTATVKKHSLPTQPKEIPYVVVLTKGDLLAGEAVKVNALSVYENKTIRENKDKLIRLFSFKESKLFPVVNYVHEQRVIPEFDALLTDVFIEILKLGKEYIDDMKDTESDDEMVNSDE